MVRALRMPSMRRRMPWHGRDFPLIPGMASTLAAMRAKRYGGPEAPV